MRVGRRGVARPSRAGNDAAVTDSDRTPAGRGRRLIERALWALFVLAALGVGIRLFGRRRAPGGRGPSAPG